MRTFLLAAGWAATLAIAFAVGQFVRPTSEAVAPPTLPKPPVATASQTNLDSELAATASTGAVAQPEVVLGSKPEQMAPVATFAGAAERKSFSDRMEGMLLDVHPIRRAATFSELLLELTPARAELLYERLQAQPATDTRSREMRLLAFAWGEVAGEQALSRLVGDANADGRGGWQRGSGLATAALAGWAAFDAGGAENWARRQTDVKDNPYLIGVIQGLSLSNPDKAAELLYTLPFGRNRGTGADLLVDSYLKDGVASAQGRIAALPADRLKDGIVRLAVGRMAQDDPAATGAWLAELEDVDLERPVEMLGAYWTRREPEAAMLWVSGLENEEVRAEGTESVIRHWPRNRVDELENWVSEIESSTVRDEAIAALVQREGYREGEVAERWLAQISNPEKRQDARKDAARAERGWRGRRNVQ